MLSGYEFDQNMQAEQGALRRLPDEGDLQLDDYRMQGFHQSNGKRGDMGSRLGGSRHCLRR